MRNRELVHFVRGLRGFVVGLPSMLATRRPLQASALRRIRDLDGRLVY